MKKDRVVFRINGAELEEVLKEAGIWDKISAINDPETREATIAAIEQSLMWLDCKKYVVEIAGYLLPKMKTDETEGQEILLKCTPASGS